MDINQFLQNAKDYRKERKYDKLSDEARKVVKYMLLELEEMGRDGKLSVNRRQSFVRLFEVKASKLDYLIVYSIYKCGAMRLKSFVDCKYEVTEEVINDINSACKELNWEVSLKIIRDLKGRLSSAEMSIGCDIQEKAP